MQRLAPELDFEVKLIDKVTVGGREVSSTYIREQVEMGKMDKAEQLLGMPYTISGEVVHGNRIGRTLGFPTVNLLPPANKLLPPNGVYYSEVIYKGRSYAAISNIGTKPTVTRDAVMGVESYLYDFEEEIYGEEIEVRLHRFKRPEQRFENLDALKEQLKRDIRDGEMGQFGD